MERSNTELTEPIFPQEEFEDFMKDNSFVEKFPSSNYAQLCQTPKQEFSTETPPLELQINDFSVWSGLENQTFPEDPLQVGPTHVAGKSVVKKVIRVGNKFLLIDDKNETNNDYCVQRKEDSQPLPILTGDENEILTAPATPSLCLQSWPGKLNFSLNLDSTKHSSNKWSFSNSLKRLFVMPDVAVPIEVCVFDWIDAYVSITPVYTDSQHHSKPVYRCPNHKVNDQGRKVDWADHIIQVDNPDAKYKFEGGRYSVDIPLGTPPPGESSKLLLVKCSCWNTCVGGPNRKAFCLVFTLLNRNGVEIGRQILQLKVCACPHRDMKNTELKIMGLINKNGKSKTRKADPSSSKCTKRIKTEPVELKYEQITVPVDIAPDVKRYVNQLVAEKYIKQNMNIRLPFPEL